MFIKISGGTHYVNNEVVMHEILDDHSIASSDKRKYDNIFPLFYLSDLGGLASSICFLMQLISTLAGSARYFNVLLSHFLFFKIIIILL